MNEEPGAFVFDGFQTSIIPGAAPLSVFSALSLNLLFHLPAIAPLSVKATTHQLRELKNKKKVNQPKRQTRNNVGYSGAAPGVESNKSGKKWELLLFVCFFVFFFFFLPWKCLFVVCNERSLADWMWRTRSNFWGKRVGRGITPKQITEMRMQTFENPRLRSFSFGLQLLLLLLSNLSDCRESWMKKTDGSDVLRIYVE